MKTTRVLPLDRKPCAKMFVDVEFNGKNGALLSLALVPTQGPAFYEALEHDETQLIDWVRENVVPVLNIVPLDQANFDRKLALYLHQFTSVEFIYNAHADARYLKAALSRLVSCPLHQFKRDGMLSAQYSHTPHNALSDALALVDQVYGSTDSGAHGITDRDVFLHLHSVGCHLDKRHVHLTYMSLTNNRVKVTLTPQIPFYEGVHGTTVLYFDVVTFEL